MKMLTSVAALALLAVPPGVVFMDAPTIESLQEKFNSLQAEGQAIIEAADKEGRDLNDEELEKINDLAEERAKIERQIAARRAVQPPQARPGENRRTTPEPRQAGQQGATTVPAQPRDGKGGFRSLGEFARHVRAAQGGNVESSRILNAQTTYGGENTGADGGYAVPPDFRRDIWVKVMAEDNLLTRCAQLVIGGNTISIPKDEVTPWDTSNGVQVYWEAEAQAPTVSKPKLGLETVRLSKLMALVPVSDELLEDAPGLDSWLRAKVPGKMTAKINEAVVNGDGNGKPLGILQSSSFVTVASHSSQSVDTVIFENIVKTYTAMYGPCRRNAVWLVNSDTEPTLMTMGFDIAATGGKVPVWLPPGGVSDSPYATLYGRPVIPLQACSTVGDIGDVIFVDLSQYWAVTKGQDVRTDVSMHLYFDQGLQAYRFTFRVNGLPAWGSSISPAHGTFKQSWAVGPGTR